VSAPPKTREYIPRGGFTCTVCGKSYPDGSTYWESDSAQGYRFCAGCLKEHLAVLAAPLPTAKDLLQQGARPTTGPVVLPPPPGPGPAQLSTAGPDWARVTLRSAYGRVEVELGGYAQPGEAPEGLLDRLRGHVRRAFEDEVDESRKQEEARNG
jgi:hypothetical protein